jgi:hypothetical protein
MMRTVPPVRIAPAAALGLVLLLTASVSFAQEIEPRAYSNIPTGLNFLAIGYAYSQGDVAFDASVPLEDASLRVHGTFLGYVRSFEFFGKSANAAIAIPYGWVSGEATFRGQPREREVNGFADPRLRLSVNLYGAPALSSEEFASYQQDLIVGVSVAVSVPLGQYDGDKLVNIGTNRWAVKPEIGLSKAWGPLTLELAAGVTFFTANDDFLGGRTLERAPLYSLQGHLIYSLPYGIWAALDAVGYRGGRTTLDGERGEDVQENVRVGLTMSFPLTRHSSVKLYGSTGVHARVGTSFNTVGIAWQVRWGGGR